MVEFFMTSECEGPNHLLIAKITCLRFAILSFSDELQNIFEVGLKKYGVMEEKSLSEKNKLEIKKITGRFVLFICQSSYCPNFEGKWTNSL